jgi:non-heme chloroperoxidase
VREEGRSAPIDGASALSSGKGRIVLLLWFGLAVSALAAEAAQAKRAAPLKSAYFNTSDGVRLHVFETRPSAALAQAPVLAFVTGWSMPAAIWEAQLTGLSAKFPTAALDPRGQGMSEVPAVGYTVERRARDIAEFVKRYPRVILIGWSLGALEALHYVHAHGDANVVGLVLVDSSVGEQPKPPDGRFTESLATDRQKTLENFVQAIFRSKRPPDQYRALLQGAMRMPLQASIDLLSYLQPREHWRDIAWTFQKPLLYVVTPQFAAQAGNLQRNRPGTQIEVFAQAGHALFVDEPQRFNALIEQFVQGL